MWRKPTPQCFAPCNPQQHFFMWNGTVFCTCMSRLFTVSTALMVSFPAVFHFRRSASILWFVRHRLCTLSVWPRAREFPRLIVSPRNQHVPLLSFPAQHTAPTPHALAPPPSGHAHRYSNVSRRSPTRLWWTRWQTDFFLFGVNFS